MTYEQILNRFGLPASKEGGNDIRLLLREEIERSRLGEDGEEMLRTLCVQLFSLAFVEDTLLIWEAKQSSFDASCGIDVQLMCGAGLQVTKQFLSSCQIPTASEAFDYLTVCEQSGNFEEFSPVDWLAYYKRYYGLV